MSCFLSNSSLGKKLVMSVTGAFLVLFILFHMSMNITAIISPEAYNTICALLGANWYALAGTAVLALGVLIHFIYAVVLTLNNYKARGSQRYAVTVQEPGVAWASKNMLALGFVILGGLLIPFVLLASAKRRERTGVVVAASALVMCGVFCKRVWLLFTSFTVTNVYGAPGISSGSTAARGADGFDMWALAGSYMPQPVEFAVVAAVVSFCILGIALLSKKLVAKA